MYRITTLTRGTDPRMRKVPVSFGENYSAVIGCSEFLEFPVLSGFPFRLWPSSRQRNHYAGVHCNAAKVVFRMRAVKSGSDYSFVSVNDKLMLGKHFCSSFDSLSANFE